MSERFKSVAKGILAIFEEMYLGAGGRGGHNVTPPPPPRYRVNSPLYRAADTFNSLPAVFQSASSLTCIILTHMPMSMQLGY